MQQYRLVNNSIQPNMFRDIIFPSSGALDCVLHLVV